MVMNEVVLGQETVTKTVVRMFAGMQVSTESKVLIILYRETIKVGDTVLSSVIKQYPRDYDFWEQNELGQTIIGMVNLDLSQNDPSTPRNTPEQV